jgi:hypothetical protein
VPLSLVCTSRCVPLPVCDHSVCDHSQGVYFPPNRRRSKVFRVLFQQTNKQIKQARKKKDNLPAPRDTPLQEPPNAKVPHDQPDSQQGQPSCASGHAPRGTSRRKGAARPARQPARTTFLRLGTRPSENLATQRRRTTSPPGRPSTHQQV